MGRACIPYAFGLIFSCIREREISKILADAESERAQLRAKLDEERERVLLLRLCLPAELRNYDIVKIVHLQRAVRRWLSRRSDEARRSIKGIALPSFAGLSDAYKDTPEAKQTRNRRRAFLEICETEKGYLEKLQVLRYFFIVPLEEASSPGNKYGLKPDDVAVLFQNTVELVKLCEIVLGDFLKISSSVESGEDTSLGNVFLKLYPTFRMYSMYCSGFDNAMKRIAKLKQNKASSLQPNRWEE